MSRQDLDLSVIREELFPTCSTGRLLWEIKKTEKNKFMVSTIMKDKVVLNRISESKKSQILQIR